VDLDAPPLSRRARTASSGYCCVSTVIRRRSLTSETRPGWSACSRLTTSCEPSEQALQTTRDVHIQPHGWDGLKDRYDATLEQRRTVVRRNEDVESQSRHHGGTLESNRDTAGFWRPVCKNGNRDARSSKGLPLLPRMADRAVAHAGNSGPALHGRLPPAGTGRGSARPSPVERGRRRASLDPICSPGKGLPPPGPRIPRRQRSWLPDRLSTQPDWLYCWPMSQHVLSPGDESRMGGTYVSLMTKPQPAKS